MIYHDDDLSRLTGQSMRVSDISLEEMRRALACVGRAVITLDQLTADYRKDTPILLHVKERRPRPDLTERFRSAREMLILGVESVDMLHAVRDFMPKERLLAFMPEMHMYPEFIENGIGIIRLWEHWLNEVSPDMVHEAGAEQVWIMCNTPEKGMDGTPESLDRFVEIGADGALVSDVNMAADWMRSRGL